MSFKSSKSLRGDFVWGAYIKKFLGIKHHVERIPHGLDL